MNPVISMSATLAAACVGAIAYAGVYPRSQLFGQTVCRTDAARKLAITFDDGPNPAITPKLLELLGKHNARATFFVVGRYVKECPEIVSETFERGYVIATHTQTHPNLFWQSADEICAELRQCQEAIGGALNQE